MERLALGPTAYPDPSPYANSPLSLSLLCFCLLHSHFSGFSSLHPPCSLVPLEPIIPSPLTLLPHTLRLLQSSCYYIQHPFLVVLCLKKRSTCFVLSVSFVRCLPSSIPASVFQPHDALCIVSFLVFVFSTRWQSCSPTHTIVWRFQVILSFLFMKHSLLSC